MSAASAEQQAAWLSQVRRWWHYYNREFLREALRAPLFELSRSTAQLGSWDRELRLLRVSTEHIERDAWSSVCETLRHEMAHQYADEVLQAHDEPPHGPAFRRACERLRVSPAATQGTAEVQTRHRLIDRVQKLFALGASPNSHEAEAALRKAHELLARERLELVELDRERSYASRDLGTVKGRRQAWEYSLANLLHEYFFVEAIWVPSYDPSADKSGSVLQVCGTLAHLELAAWVHSYLSELLERLWKDYRKRKGLRGNGERRRYFEGVLHGFSTKLAEERSACAERGLVVVEDPKLTKFFRWQHPRVRTSYGTTKHTESYADGQRDGRHVQLHRPLRGTAGGDRHLLEGS